MLSDWSMVERCWVTDRWHEERSPTQENPCSGFGSAHHGGAKACSATGNVSFLRHSLADWGLGCFETSSCSDPFLPVASALILRSSGIAAFSFVTFSSNVFPQLPVPCCWDFKLSLYLTKYWFSFSLFLTQLLKSWILCIALDLLGFPMQMPKELVIQVSSSVSWQVLITLLFAYGQEEIVTNAFV